MKKLLAKILIACILITTMGTLKIPTVTNAAVQYSYYVSTTGNDSNPGTLSQPFLTISKARDVVRTVNSNMTGDILVYLREGTYTLDSTLQLTSQDSGTNGFNVIYNKYLNETPVISGGKNVTGWNLLQFKWF